MHHQRNFRYDVWYWIFFDQFNGTKKTNANEGQQRDLWRMNNGMFWHCFHTFWIKLNWFFTLFIFSEQDLFTELRNSHFSEFTKPRIHCANTFILNIIAYLYSVYRTLRTLCKSPHNMCAYGKYDVWHKTWQHKILPGNNTMFYVELFTWKIGNMCIIIIIILACLAWAAQAETCTRKYTHIQKIYKI